MSEALLDRSVTETCFELICVLVALFLLFINIAARLLMDIIGENRTGLLTFNFLCKIEEVAQSQNIGWVCLGSSQGVYITLCGFNFLGEN